MMIRFNEAVQGGFAQFTLSIAIVLNITNIVRV